MEIYIIGVKISYIKMHFPTVGGWMSNVAMIVGSASAGLSTWHQV